MKEMKNESAKRAVVVTGASSGIGRAGALLLARQGYTVFAGVRREADGEALRQEAEGNLTPLLLDVTDGGSLARAGETVAAAVGEAGLAGLVNNAGIGIAGPVEYLPLDTLRQQFDVNVFGQIGVIQVFLPLLRRARGRIINIGSVGDRITIPFGGALCASKAAFASLTEALRLELHPWGIHVCLIEPGAIHTPAVDKVRRGNEALLAAMPAEGRRLYSDMFHTFTERGMKQEEAGSRPDVVGEAIYRALTAAHPPTRYPVGKNASLLVFLGRFIPDRLLDPIRLRLFGMPTAFGALAEST